MTYLTRALALFVTLASPAFAQSFVQIEAQPTRAKAIAKAETYGTRLGAVTVHDMANGWFGIALGPFDEAEARARLSGLRAEGLIPGDSYVASGADYAVQVWPEGPQPGVSPVPAPVAGDVTSAPLGASPATEPTSAPVAEPVAAPAPEPLAVEEPEETPKEARASEAALGADERKALQEALAWQGFYKGAIDGSLGPGSRKAMAAWQEALGYEATGVLTSRQRAALLDAVAAERAVLGLGLVTEEEAGIEIALPLNLVEFARYEHPFAIFDEKNGSGLQVLLISRQGDQTTLGGLYDLMQTLEIVPISGERSRSKTGFVLTGQNDEIASYTEVGLKGGLIKGFTLVWKPEAAKQAERSLAAMRASFRAVGDTALSEALSAPSAVPSTELLKGITVRRPTISRSGFYVSADGLVATTAEVLKDCARLTLDGGVEAEVLAEDAAAGLALLKPKTALAPLGFASFAAGPAPKGADIAVSGYSYEEALPAPVATFGQLSDTTGLGGETDMLRLTIRVLPGDSGGPLLDGSGAVAGLLLGAQAPEGKVLPQGVAFARPTASLLPLLESAGVAPATAEASGALAAEDIAAKGSAMTTLVSCWK